MGSHQNKNAIRKIEKRLGAKERVQGVDFVVGGNAYEFAETKEDITESVGQLNRSRVPGSKKLIIPNNLENFAKKAVKSTGIGIENISGKILKKSRKK
jgi:hypothetical protein